MTDHSGLSAGGGPTGDGGSVLLRVSGLADLGLLPPLPPGAKVLVEETREVFSSVGNTTADIAARLGWVQVNVWLPEHVAASITARHPVFIDLAAAAQMVLAAPQSVHEDRRGQQAVYFIVDGNTLRAAGLLTSRSTRHVDAVVEWWWAHGRAYLRLFHLSPVQRNKGGRQLWP